MASNYDTGGQGVGYSVSSTNGSANSYRSDGVDLEAATSPATGDDLGWTAAGQWFRYTVNVSTAGTYTVSILVAAPTAVADAFHISNSSGTNLSGSVAVPATGGYQTWVTVTATVTLPAGTQTLTVNQDAAGWNIDSLKFASSGGGGCTTKPNAPTGLAASGTTSTTTNLAWTATTAPSGCSISSYTVLKGGASIGTATGTSFAVTGLTASTNYSFTVEATDAAGTSAASSAVSVTTSAASGGEGPYPSTAAAIPGTVMAENYDTGGQGVAYNVTSTNGTANTYRPQGVDLEAATAPATGNDLGWSAAGQWFRYTVNVSTAGTYTASFLVASPTAVADAFHISNSSGTNLTGSVAVPATGGYQTWVTVTATVTLPVGTQTLTLNDDAAGWNIDSLAFALNSSGGEGPYGGTPAAIPGTVMNENYDTGGQGVAYNVTSTNGSANSYRSDGVDLEAATSPATGNDLGWSAAGQWFRYTVNVSTAGTYTASFLVASPTAVGDAFHLSSSSGANLTGSVAVPATGGYQTWTTVTAKITLPAGKQTLTLSEDAAGWNIDSFTIGTSAPPSGPRLVGYLPNYYASYGTFATTLSFNKMTHLLLAFGNPPTCNGTCTASSNMTFSLGQSNADITTLVNAAHAAGVKVLVSIGGGGGDQQIIQFYEQGLSSQLIASLNSFVTQFNLDGVDLDIESPGSMGTPYATFAADLDSTFHPQNKLVTAAVAEYLVSGSGQPNGMPLSTLPMFDFVNDMVYSDLATGQAELAWWTSQGEPASKITLGVPFFGQSSDGNTEENYSTILAAYPSAGSEKTQLGIQYGGVMIWDLGADAAPPNSLLTIVQNNM
jgi:hypothetical protein